MELRPTAKCKNLLRDRLLHLGYSYDPKFDPIPTLTLSHLHNDNTMVFSIGGLSIVVKDKEKAKKLKLVLEQYHDDIRESRKIFKTRKDTPKVKPKAKGGYVPSPTPYSDIQEDLDKAMGGIGIAMGIAATILLFAFLLLMKKFGH